MEAPARPAAEFTSTRESPCCHSWTGFVRCWPVRAKPSAPRAALDVPGRAAVHRQLDEGVAVQLLRWRQLDRGGPPADLGRQPGGRLLLERQQGPQRVDGRPRRVRLPEDVVEDLEGQRSGVARGQHVAEEGRQVERPLAGEEAVVPAPLQDVHVHVRGVGQLQEEQLLAGDVGDPGRVGATGEDVEAVDAEPERRMVGAADDLPGPLVGVDEACPRERLVAEAEAALAGALRELVQLLGDAVVVVEGVRGDRRADQDQIRAELLHDVELALGPADVRREDVGVVRVEVTEGLVQVDREAEVAAPGAQLRGGPRGGDEVRLEDLHPVETGGRGRHQLVLQRAGQAHGRDGGPHAGRPARGQRWPDDGFSGHERLVPPSGQPPARPARRGSRFRPANSAGPRGGPRPTTSPCGGPRRAASRTWCP